ncbi:MAG: glycine cleavage system aminomethyltransferase GcvT [Acidobacteriota bacterium]
MGETLRRTPLFAWHQRSGARLVDFAGWEMPVQFSGVIDEHNAVRTQAGLFDVSHMGELMVTGAGAQDFLQRMTPNDCSKLVDGQAHYSALLEEHGTFIDDLLVYRRGEDRFLLVVNASNCARDLAWLEDHRSADVVLEDQSDSYGLLALQGPRAAEILTDLGPAELADLRYYRFTELDFGFGDSIVSRTGYTGEDGFEVYVPAEHAEGLWTALLETGESKGLKPAGLGARDTLRLEAGMLLSGQDMGGDTTPIEVGLDWIVKLKKGDFVGRDALVAQKRGGVKRCMIAFELDGRRPARPGSTIVDEGLEVGRVTSGTWSPSLERPIGLALVETGEERAWTPGEEIEVSVRGKSCHGVVVELPFVRKS